MVIFLFLLSCSQASVSKGKQCGQHLVPVPKEDPVFCMMPFEAMVSGVGLHLSSKKGNLPEKNVSLTAAMKHCEEMPVLDADGNEKGRMRLATLQNWRDAGDGILGEGGKTYPWGEVDDGRCILDHPKRPKRWKEHQPSGTAEDCKSIFGVYDQIGNLWEWVDLELKAELAEWLIRMKEQGFSMSVNLQTEEIYIAQEEIRFVMVNSICIQQQRLFVQDGVLYTKLTNPMSPHCEFGGEGYLLPNNVKNPQKGDILPIHAEPTENPLIVKILYASQREGERVGAKVGGSFYSGAGNDLETIWIGHIPSFNGSIGFRCEAEPF